MSETTSIISAFLIGLLGSLHCIGMCGGIVGALTMGLPDSVRRSVSHMLQYLLAYNTGRIISYGIAGSIVGLIGGQLYSLDNTGLANQIGQWLSAAFMLALGIYLLGWTRILAPIERAGGKLWHYIEPVGKRFLPVKSPPKALALGLVWGWLPCGMVYSVLVLAMTTGSALQSAQVMLAFGLGTLPMLLTMGAAAKWLGNLLRTNWVRRTAGTLIIGFAMVMIMSPSAHQHHQNEEAMQDGAHSEHEHHAH